MSVTSLLVCALVSALSAADAAATSLSCVPCGYGGGGRFTAIAVDPRNPMTVLAGSDVAGVFKSTDGGDSFVLSGTGLNSFAIAAIAFHPELPDLVYTLTDSGLYLSLDCAQSWHLISDAVAVRERFFGSSLLVCLGSELWAGTDRAGVFKLKTGSSGPVVEHIPGLSGARVSCLAAHRGLIHAATSRGMFRLEGSLWREAGRGLPAGGTDITDLAAHPSGRLYAVSKTGGLYIFKDTAQSWVRAESTYAANIPGRPQAFKALAVHPDDPDRVFLATHPEQWPYLLLESRDAGRLWRRTGSFPQPAPPLAWRETPEAIEAIFLCPQIPERMFLADWWNLWRSSDGGRTWQQLTRGLQNAVVNDIKQHPGDPATFFMATADNGLLRSIDSGTSWQRIMNGVKDGSAMSVALSQSDGRAMYLLINPWQKQDRLLAYTSTDNGTTWKDIGFSIAGLKLPDLPFVNGIATNIVPDPHCDGVVYVGTNGYGIFKTADNGRTWAAKNAGLAAPYLKSPAALLAHSAQPDTLFAATQGGGIYKTTDGAQSWQRVSPGREFVFSLAVDPFNPERIIAACAGKKLLMSADGGSTWAERTLPGQTPEHIAAHTVAFDTAVPGRLYAGTLAYGFRAADGLYVSADAGKTFAAVVLDLPRVSMNALAVGHAPHRRLLMGFNGIGLYCADTMP